MSEEVEVSALAIDVAVPERLQRTDVRRGEELVLPTDRRPARWLHLVPGARPA